jgi:hypothetical protein
MVNPVIFGLLPLIASHGIMITQQGDGFCFFPITPNPTLNPTSQPIIKDGSTSSPSFEKEKEETFKNTTLRLGNTGG